LQLAYTIIEMRMVYEEKVESSKDKKERKRLKDGLFEETQRLITAWMNNQAWGQAKEPKARKGLQELKETCAFTVTLSFVDAES
jgi:hypothetical protein